MPTYDYQCRTCGHRFEYFQSMSSDVLTHCPVEQCRGTEEQKGKGEVTRRVGAGAGLVFKGEGFYLTDYVRKSGEGDSKSAPPAKADAGGSGAKEAPSKGSGSSEGGAGKSEGSGTSPSGSKTSGGSDSGAGGTKGGTSSKSSSGDAAKT